MLAFILVLKFVNGFVSDTKVSQLNAPNLFIYLFYNIYN